MALSPDDAIAALKAIEHTAGRATQARSYGHTSPHFIIWGLVTLICYGLADVLSASQGGMVWAVGSLTGLVASVVAGRCTGKGAEGGRYLASFLALAGFVVATGVILPPGTSEAGSAFISLVVATAYLLMGIWRGGRILVTGLVLGALTVGGYLMIHRHFDLYMGVVTGGALILAGFWLRRV